MRFILILVTKMKGIGNGAEHAWPDSHASSVDSAKDLS